MFFIINVFILIRPYKITILVLRPARVNFKPPPNTTLLFKGVLTSTIDAISVVYLLCSTLEYFLAQNTWSPPEKCF